MPAFHSKTCSSLAPAALERVSSRPPHKHKTWQEESMLEAIKVVREGCTFHKLQEIMLSQKQLFMTELVATSCMALILDQNCT